MKKILILACLTAVAFASCKTTEANYREAYQKAVAARNVDDDIDAAQLPSKYVIEGPDTIAVKVENVSVLKTDDAQAQLNAFSVVVAKFRQRFNAMSLRERLVQSGYAGAIVAATASDGYYVIAASFPTARKAKAEAEKLTANPPVTLSKGMPFVLRDPRKK